MKRNFITNLALLLLLNLLVKPLYAFGIDVGVQNAVGTQSYGSYFILLNFSIIFQIILDLGIENLTRREIARHHNLLNSYFSNILPLKVMLGLVYFLVCSVIGFILDWHYNEFRLLMLLLFNQFLASFILYFRANLGGLHMFWADSIVSVTDRFLVVIICGFLLINPETQHNFQIEWLIYAQTAAYLVNAGIAFFMVYRKALPIRFDFNLPYYISLLRQSLPYALLILLMATYLRIDSVLLGKLLVNGKEQAGVYAQSFRIVEIFSNYGYLFTIILLPVFSRLIQQGESVAQLTRLSFTLLLLPAVVVAVGCMGYRDEIIGLLYKEHLESSSRVFGILIFSFPGICITYIFGTLLTANGSLRQLNIMAGMAVLINLVLNYFLIRKFGVFGAAMANMITQAFTSVYQILLVRHTFHFSTDYTLLSRIALFIGLIVASMFLIRNSAMPWYYSFGIYLMIGAALAFATRLIHLKAIFKMILSYKTS